MNRRQLLRLGMLAPLAPRALAAPVALGVHDDVFTEADVRAAIALLEKHNGGYFWIAIHPDSILAKLQRGEPIE